MEIIPREYTDVKVRKPEAMSLASKASLSCVLWDKMMQFDLSELRSDTWYKNQTAGIIFNFCEQFTILHNGVEKNTYVFSNDTEYTYTPMGAGVPYTNTIMTNSKSAVLAGANGNPETNHYITYDFNSNVKCGLASSYKTKVAVFCEPDGKRQVSDADFIVTKNADRCEINISIRHPAGCPMVNLRQVVDFFRNNPTITAVVMVLLGFVSTFYGGKWFDEFAGIVGGFITSVFILLVFSMIGMTRAFDSSSGSKSFLNIILLGIALIVSAGGFYGIFHWCQKDKHFAPAYLAGLIGVYIGFFLYRWTFQLFWDNFIVLGVLITTFALVMGGYAYCYAFRLILPITAGLGSIFMLRGVSVLLGGFPSDFSSFTGSS